MDISMVNVVVEGRIGTVELNRPDKRNALNHPMLAEILDALTRLERDPDVHVIVLRGAGKTFCSGLDLAEMQALRDKHGTFEVGLLPEVFERLAHCPKPTIAVVHGAAIAGGCELALHCDIRIGSPSAKFVMPLAKLGVVIPTFAAERLVQLIGLAEARDMLITADVVDGIKAERIGLMSRLVEHDLLSDAARHLADAVAANAPLALMGIKHVLNHLAPTISPEARATLDAERHAGGQSDEMREGLTAFFERRAPVFKGLPPSISEA